MKLRLLSEKHAAFGVLEHEDRQFALVSRKPRHQDVNLVELPWEGKNRLMGPDQRPRPREAAD